MKHYQASHKEVKKKDTLRIRGEGDPDVMSKNKTKGNVKSKRKRERDKNKSYSRLLHRNLNTYERKQLGLDDN